MNFFSKLIVVVLFLALCFGAAWRFLEPDSLQNTVSESVENIKTTVTTKPLPELVLKEHIVPLPDGTDAVFRLAEPFEISVAAEGLGKGRFMAMSPDGRLFVPDLVNYNLSHQGKLYVLGGYDEETHQFKTKHTYLSGLRGPNSVAFYTDAEGNDWLYLALTAHLVRYPYRAGDIVPSGPAEIVYEFPNKQSPGEVSVVWHITRTLLFQGDKLYISIGSGCNSCEHLAGDLRGMVVVMNPDGTDARMYADGLRNSVGIEWAMDALYVTNNGVDHLGVDRPNETMYRLIEGEHYGWPFCYESDGAYREDTTSTWDEPIDCANVPRPLTAFEPRSAPLGLAFFENAHPMLEGTFLVSLHGSFDANHQKGYEIVRVTPTGETSVFMDGFQRADTSRTARAVDIFQLDDNSFFFTDDFNGRLYYIYARE